MNLLIKLITATALVGSISACGGGGGGTTEPPAPVIEGSIRVIHASSDAPRVNVLANNEIIAGLDKLDYKSGSAFIDLEIGSYPVSVETISPDGSTNTVIGPTTVTIEEDVNTTVIALGKLSSIEPVIITHPETTVATDKVSVQILHASPDTNSSAAGPVDLYVTSASASLDSETPLDSLDFKDLTQPLEIDASNYRFRITPAGSKTPIFDTGETGISLAGGSKLLIIAVDNTSASDSPTTLLLSNGNTTTTLADATSIAKVRVVHTSPDIADVEVYVNNQSDEFVPSLTYGQSSPGGDDYRDFEPGDYRFYVGPNDNSIGSSEYDATLTLLGDAFYTLYVNGRIDNQLQFGFTILSSENRSLPTEARVSFVNGAIDAGTMNVYITPTGVYTPEELIAGDSGGPDIADLEFDALANVTDFLSLVPGNYDIRAISGTTTVVNLENFVLAGGGVYRIAAAGASEDGITPTDGAVILER